MPDLTEHRIKRYQKVSNILTALDIILAISIILTGSQINSPFGSAALIFGLCMLALVTTLKIFQKW